MYHLYWISLLFLSLSKLFINLSSKIFPFLEYTCNVVWLWNHTRLGFVCYFFFRNQCIRFLKDDLFTLPCCESLYSFPFPLFPSLRRVYGTMDLGVCDQRNFVSSEKFCFQFENLNKEFYQHVLKDWMKVYGNIIIQFWILWTVIV